MKTVLGHEVGGALINDARDIEAGVELQIFDGGLDLMVRSHAFRVGSG